MKPVIVHEFKCLMGDYMNLAFVHQQILAQKVIDSSETDFLHSYAVKFDLPKVKPFKSNGVVCQHINQCLELFGQIPLNAKWKVTGYDPVARRVTVQSFYMDFIIQTMMDFKILNKSQKLGNPAISINQLPVF